MQKPTDPTHKLLLTSEEELFATIVHERHPFRRLNDIIDFPTLIAPMRATYSTLGATGIDVDKGVKALLVQFWENYSDREMEQAVRENLAVRWFCGFSLSEATPDYSYFSKLRKRIGTKRIADMFKGVNATLEARGLFGNVFAFIDASTIITKTALWDERDRALRDGAEKLNNKNVMDYAADEDARWGAKSKKNIWFGYKRHAAVDMRHGLITKVAVTPANTPDMKAVEYIMPEQGAVFMDKGYDYKEVERVALSHGCHAAIIRKNNNAEKDYDLDRFRSGIRMPFEGVFSKMRKRARYRGHAKVSMQAFFQAIVHNLKKAVRFLVPPPRLLVT